MCFFNTSHHFPTALAYSNALLLLVLGELQLPTGFCVLPGALSCCVPQMWVPHGAWPLGDRTVVGAAHTSAILGTALLVSEDGEFPDLVSKLLCKPSVYLEDCVKFWPPCFQEDREVEEVLPGQLGQQ